MRGRALLAWNIRRLRSERSLTQERLAADAGVDRGYVSSIELQKVAVSVDVLDKLATLLGVGIGELFAAPAEGEEPPKPLSAGRRPSKIR